MNRNIHYIYNIALLLLFGAATPAFAQTIKGNIYGGGQLGKVAGNTNVTIESGSVETGASGGSNIFGGGYQAEVAGNTTIDINGGGAGNVYGGGEAANIVVGADETGKTVVNLNGGTVHHSVYGGGLGNTTNVATSTTVTASGGTVTEDVYGGSGFGKVGATTVIINNGATVKRDVFGGGFGQNADAGKEAYEADVNGNASVTINKGAVISGNVYGGNNTNGSPKGAITVLVDGPANATEKESTPLELNNVFGGGKNAATTSSSNDIPAPKVTIQGCETVINRVFGGGDAASAPATDVEIWGGHITNAFAGGNGEVVAAHVGYLADGTTPYTYGTGNTSITIKGGVIENVFGGSNTAGNIRGEVSVSVEKDAAACDMQITNLYGGGNEASGKAGTINIVCTGEDGRIENVYGGANKADVTGDITLNIKGGQITNVFGGNNNSGSINGAITVNVDWLTGDDACGKNSLTNVYGGGNLAPYTTPDGKVGPTVNLINGTVSNNVYGGGYGKAAVVTGNPIINLVGGIVTNDIFGGGDAAPVTGNPQVNANYGSVKDIFAGGRGSTAVVTGDPKAYINKTDEKTLAVVDVYGGGDAANVVGTGNVQLDKGTVANIYGGGNAANVTNTDVIINGGEATMAFAGGHGDKTAEPQKEANVTGDAHLTIHGGTVAKAFAGSNSKGTITGSQLVTINKTGDALAELHVTEVYGGGNQADGKAGTFDIGCTGSDTEGIGDLFGGAREANITGNIAFTIEGGKINRIFGGNNVSGNVAGSITVNIAENTTKYDCGLHAGYVYGGGQDAAYTPTTKGAYPEVNISGGTIANDVFGGGLGKTATVTSNPVVNISGGSIGNNVFGGGSLAETGGNPTVNVRGGTVTHDVYGGGALADVTGNTTVNLTGGAVGGAYGGALGQKNGVNGATSDIAAYVNGNTTVTLNGTKITETGVFGCNNLNGTPKGHAYVHVLSTTPRDEEEYDVPAVYGGGNLSAYEPTDDNDYAEVLIEGCDNSIDYVYGGGNAAPVPATSVTIYGANAINHAFAGGNGAGSGNPGADVGYLGYFSQGHATIYGTGEARIKVLGGTVHNVYGGSNTLGYIGGGAYVSVDNPKTDDPHATGCELNVGKVYGGGNEADIECDIHMDLDCNEGGQILYAGANNANVHGNIILNIHSGTYGQVFCGNNEGGKIFGKLQVNVDETGCWPVMIGELYACGNLAPYSVRGWHTDGKARTEEQFNALTADEKAAENFKEGKPYDDPEVNLISFTRIGKVFGGGYGESAVLYGNTNVNVEPIPGIYADGSPTPSFILDTDDNRVANTDNSSVADALGADKIGSIGTIYGGGNKGAVYGNTNVNIGLKTKNKHISGDDTTTEEEVAVTITGNVFGGGNEAIVSGNTNVKIGADEE